MGGCRGRSLQCVALPPSQREPPYVALRSPEPIVVGAVVGCPGF